MCVSFESVLDSLCIPDPAFTELLNLFKIKQARIDELEYTLSVVMCEHEDAEYMTGRERDSMAIKVLRGTT